MAKRVQQQQEQAEVLALHALVIDHFDKRYGRDETRLESWQSLCRDVGMTEGPSINKCKKALRGIYINIVDFVEAKENGRAIKTFASPKALRNYMRQNDGKFFPKNKAKESPILKWMLIFVR